jgi:DNA-binding XRE family transcriptional regulator
MKNLKEQLRKVATPFKEILSELPKTEQDEINRHARYYKLEMMLREYRKSQKLSQAEFAAKVNMPRTMISKIETGNRNVTLETLMTLAQGMGKELVIDFK